MPKQAKQRKPTQTFTDFTNRLTAKWQLLMQPNASIKPQPDESLEDILRDLVAIPTTPSNREANTQALDYIERFLHERGMQVKRLAWNDIESLVATTRATKTPMVYLAGHVDVVPGPPELFQLRKEDGKYYGRGVMDMKIALAAYLKLVDDLHKQGTLAQHDFGIMINTDEEVGGMDGAAHLAEEGYLPKVMVVPDGAQDWNIEKFAKGIWWATLNATGRSAHASRPWEGSSATETLLAALADIQKLFPTREPHESTYNIGTIRGGEAPNQIPSSASTTLDFRLASDKDDHHIRTEVQDICNKYGIELVSEVYFPPVANDPENPYIKSFAATVAKHIGRQPDFVMSYAMNDARFFAVKGVPCILFYPHGGDHHSANEWIGEECPQQMLDILTDYIKDTARIER